ncbi:hypothetical protein D9M68_910280 [compost metagenome]
MKHVVDAMHCLGDAIKIADVTNMELELLVVQRDAHVLLLFLVATEDPDLSHVGIEKTTQHRVAERAGTSGDQQGLASKHLKSFSENRASA